jgi:hypothetical protein
VQLRIQIRDKAVEVAYSLSETKSGHLYFMLSNPIISLVGTTSGIICHRYHE